MAMVAVLALLVACQTLPSDTQSSAAVEKTLEAEKLPQFVRADILRLRDADPRQRARGAYRLGKLGAAAKAAIPYLVELLNDETATVMSSYLGGGYHSSADTTPAAEAAKALGHIGEVAHGPLVVALQHGDVAARRNAAKALGMISAIDSIEPLMKALDDPAREVRAAAAVALARYHHPLAAQTIIDYLPKAKPRVRPALIYALAGIDDLIAVRELVRLGTTRDPNMRAAVAYALGKLRDRRALTTLLAMLHDEDAAVRANAAHALGNYPGNETIEALIGALDDEREAVRESVAEALFELTGKDFGATRQKWQRWWQAQAPKRSEPERFPRIKLN
jgi:HEAT repeat protein